MVNIELDEPQSVANKVSDSPRSDFKNYRSPPPYILIWSGSSEFVLSVSAMNCYLKSLPDSTGRWLKQYTIDIVNALPELLASEPIDVEQGGKLYTARNMSLVLLVDIITKVKIIKADE